MALNDKLKADDIVDSIIWKLRFDIVEERNYKNVITTIL